MKQETLEKAIEMNIKISALGAAIKRLQAKCEQPQPFDPHDEVTEDQCRRLR